MKKSVNGTLGLILSLWWITPTLAASRLPQQDHRAQTRRELARLPRPLLSARQAHAPLRLLAFKRRQSLSTRPLSYTERRRMQRLEAAEASGASLPTQERQQLETLQERYRHRPLSFRERQRLQAQGKK